MENNMTQQLQSDSVEMQNMFKNVVTETFKALPRPKVPAWLESTGEFIKVHPWISLAIVLFVLLVISSIIREIICSYFKVNEILSRLKRIEEKLERLGQGKGSEK